MKDVKRRGKGMLRKRQFIEESKVLNDTIDES
jgi:hypothetical protein